MEITDSVLDSLSSRIMALPGIDPSRDSFVLMEDVDDGEVFFKFMSDGGETDGKNGRALNGMFTAEGIEVDYFDDRKFIVSAENLELLLSKKEVT